MVPEKADPQIEKLFNSCYLFLTLCGVALNIFNLILLKRRIDKMKYLIKVFGIIICLILLNGCDTLPKTAESESMTDITVISQTTMPLEITSDFTADEIDTSVTEKTDESLKDASDFLFSDNDNGGVTVYEYIGDESNVVIPEEIDGIPVTEIFLPLFYPYNYPYNDEKDIIETLTIPKSVNKIIIPNSIEWGRKCTDYFVADGNDFYTDINGVLYSADMSTLVLYPKGKQTEEFKIPEPVEIIFENAFSGCSNLHSLHFPSSVKAIDEYAFKHCTALEEILFTDGLEIIGEGAFRGCSLLKTVSFPKTLRSLGVGTFWGCPLTEITIPTGITENALDPFHDCDLENITVYPAGEGLSVENDIMKLGDMWIKMLPQSEIESVIAESSIRLNGCVFRNCKNLKEFAVKDGCEVLCVTGDDFYNCPGLERMYLPQSVKHGCLGVEEGSHVTIYTQMGSSADEEAERLGLKVIYVDSYEDYLNVTETD